MHILRLAKELAVEAKLHNCVVGSDYGFLYPDEYAMTNAEWKSVCNEIDRILPTVQPTKAQWIEHAAAMRGYTSTDPIMSDA